MTGRPFLARLEVANPGPVILVIEESGESALWRRLDSLSRGRAIPRDELADLHYAANKRIRLDDLEWQNELLAAGHAIGPRLIILDPLARLKAPGRDENAQAEYAVLVEFIRRLRDETGSAVAFVQHTGHTGGHMRGTSDLESVWESRLGFRRDSSTVTIDAEHREAESAAAISYRLKWDDQTRTIRLEELADSVPAKVARYLADNPGASANEVAKELGGNRQEVLAEVRRQRSEGGSDGQNHRGTTSAGSGSGSGSPAGSLPKGNQAGTTPALPGSVSGNHPSESEVDRLEALAGEMGL